jgi:hypothetical protein
LTVMSLPTSASPSLLPRARLRARSWPASSRAQRRRRQPGGHRRRQGACSSGPLCRRPRARPRCRQFGFADSRAPRQGQCGRRSAFWRSAA